MPDQREQPDPMTEEAIAQMSNAAELREQAKAQHRTAGLWGIMNSLKRTSDVERAVVAKQNGVDPGSLPNFLTEIPFGNTTVVQQSAESKAPSTLGVITKAAVLALAAGAAGFGLSQINMAPKPIPLPPPVDAVLEWEITPDGETRGSHSSVLSTERGVHQGSRTEISGGDNE